jgi:hypothetical protein
MDVHGQTHEDSKVSTTKNRPDRPAQILMEQTAGVSPDRPRDPEMNSGMIHIDPTINSQYPLVICYVAIRNGQRKSGFTHEKWLFSMAMLVYQRVIIPFPLEIRNETWRSDRSIWIVFF